jgi:enoyl-CoA hydratase/carnithine racemase
VSDTLPFDYELTDGVAVLTLNRPDRMNALTFEVYAALRDYFRDLRTDTETRAVVLTGKGRGFCSGGDVEDIIGKLLDRPTPDVLEFARMTGAVIRHMRNCRKPIIAAVNGTAAGAGAVLALASDLRILSDRAKLAFLFPKVGLCGADMGAAYLLPRIVGHGRASEILLFGDPVLAKDALEMGLANRVVPGEECLPLAMEWARRFASGPYGAHSMTKEMLTREADMGLAEAIEAEAQAQTILMCAQDFKEGYYAFTEKRDPKWSGR